MSARYFCDGCGEELIGARRVSRDQQGRLFGRVPIPGGKTMFVQVITGTDQTWNGGDYCNTCIAACLRSALSAKDADVLAPDHEPHPQEA